MLVQAINLQPSYLFCRFININDKQFVEHHEVLGLIQNKYDKHANIVIIKSRIISVLYPLENHQSRLIYSRSQNVKYTAIQCDKLISVYSRLEDKMANTESIEESNNKGIKELAKFLDKAIENETAIKTTKPIIKPILLMAENTEVKNA